MKKIIVVLAFLCLGFTYRGVNEEVVPIDGTCVLYLDMESINSTQAHDLSQSHNNGTISGATRTVDEYGQYLSFDGTNDYVNCGLATDLSSSDFTASVWIKYSGDNSWAISQSHTLTPSYSSDWLFPDGAQLRANIFFMRSVVLGDESTINDNIWHHLVMVWDRTSETYEGYVDGGSIGTSGTVSGYGGVSTVKVGSTGDATTGFFTGSIDDFRVFSRALTAQEIIDLFESTRGRYGI